MEVGIKAETNVCAGGDVEIVTMAGNSISKFPIQNVLHVPDFDFSLISVSTREEKDVFNTFENRCCRIVKGGREIVSGSLRGTLYVIGDKKQTCTVGSAYLTSPMLWHEHPSHMT